MLGMQWRIQERVPGGGAPLFIFRLNWGPKSRQKFFGDRTPPPYLWVWISTPPSALFQGLDPALVCIQINGGCLVGQLTNQ